MKIVQATTMRALDARTMESGTSGFTLMERAGLGAYRELRRFVATRLSPRHCQSYTVLAGKGNNGGDAYVVARLLAENGFSVRLYATTPLETLKGAAYEHACLATRLLSRTVVAELPAEALQPGTVIVDGLLGIGVCGALRAPFIRLIEQINCSNLPVVSLDIPSGISEDYHDGQLAVRADMTILMGLPKASALNTQGRSHCGMLRWVDIGIPDEFIETAESLPEEAIFAADVAQLLPRRASDTHKNLQGHVMIAGGSAHYGGAPLLSAAAAMQSGAGLVSVLRPENSARFPIPLLSLIVRDLPDGGHGFFGPEAIRDFARCSQQAQALVVGPGMGCQAASTVILEAAFATGLPMVLDADGLRLLAAEPTLATKKTAPLVLTPHPGEMRTLLAGFGLGNLLEATRSEQARALANCLDCIVVLKGMGTLVAAPGGKLAINTSGTAALASAGTGDVLAGLLGAFLAQGMSPWDASRIAVFVHGLAAELAPGAMRSLTADKLLNYLGVALAELSPTA